MTGVRRVWVTRAEPGATRTAERVRGLGLLPIVQPLLTVRFVDADLDLGDVGALAFTSRNAVEAFARLQSARGLPVYAVGDATAEAARGVGFGAIQSAEGDLAALAALIRQAHVAGDGVVLNPGPAQPAGDLAALTGPEIVVRSVVVYATGPTIDALTPAFDIVLVHSARAAKRLADRLAGEDVAARAVVALSRAAGLPVEPLGFARLLIADRPDEDAMMAALGKAAGGV